MRGRTNMAAAGGGAEWKELPAAAQTRAPSPENFSFSVEFDSIPEGVIIKGDTYHGLAYCGYIFDSTESFSTANDYLSIISAKLQGNVFSGTINYVPYGFPAKDDFYYKEF